MIRINLLPHRAAKRALRKREFNVVLLGTAIIAAALWYVGKLYLDERIASQQRRNDYLIAENKKLTEQIDEIKKLKEQTDALLARKQVVETLQVNRSASVKLLDQLARQLPDGVYLKAIKQVGQDRSLYRAVAREVVAADGATADAGAVLALDFGAVQHYDESSIC